MEIFAGLIVVSPESYVEAHPWIEGQSARFVFPLITAAQTGVNRANVQAFQCWLPGRLLPDLLMS